MRDHPATAGAAKLETNGAIVAGGSALEAAGFGFAGDGRPMGGFAEWLFSQAPE
jgi:hypothetical protein